MNWKNVEQNPIGAVDRDGWVTLFDGYDKTRLFAILLSSGGFDYVVGYLDANGSLFYQDSGDPAGWEWDSIAAYIDIEPPSASGQTPAAERKDV